MDKGFIQYKDGYRAGEVSIYKTKIPNNKAELAIELIRCWGLVMAKDTGLEDTAGRFKPVIAPVEDVVQRACDIADEAITEMEKRGWYLELPIPIKEGLEK